MPSDPRDEAPKTTPTAMDAESPFDSTVRRANPTVAESDPPTALVRHDSFRELPPGSVVDDTYEVDARIGSGAMGEVYAARHMKLGKRVAIKVIGRRLSEDDSAIERFAMEARTLAQIQHPAIVAVDHVGELADGRAYFVMEFLRGETLFDRIARGRASLDEALRIIDQMARGLEAAHQKGVTHRDLKPENVFLVHIPGEHPIIKLVDFGLAKLAADVAEVDFRAERTQSGVAIGTPMYMSPEQSRGPDVDHRTDIYALGCIAYELVLGRPPFPHARTAPEFWAAHLSETPPHPRTIWPEVPPQLDLALFAMLAKDPTVRPTLAQIRAVVTSVAATLPERAGDRAATMLVDQHGTRARRQWLVAVAVVTVAAIAAGATLVAVGTSRARPAIAPAPPAKVEQAEHVGPRVENPSPQVDASAAPPDLPAKPPLAKTPARSTGRSPARVAVERPVTKRGSGEGSAAPSPPLDPPAVGSTDQPKTIDRNQTVNPFAKKRRQNP